METKRKNGIVKKRYGSWRKRNCVSNDSIGRSWGSLKVSVAHVSRTGDSSRFLASATYLSINNGHRVPVALPHSIYRSAGEGLQDLQRAGVRYDLGRIGGLNTSGAISLGGKVEKGKAIQAFRGTKDHR